MHVLSLSCRTGSPTTGSTGCQLSGVWRRGEIGKGRDCNTWPRQPHSKHVWNIPSHNLLQTNYCTRNSRKNAIVLRPLPAIASHELLHELWRQQTTIAATTLAESTPSPKLVSQAIWDFPDFFGILKIFLRISRFVLSSIFLSQVKGPTRNVPEWVRDTIPCDSSEMGRIRFRRAGLQTPDILGPHRVPGREVSEFLLAYHVCTKANSPFFGGAQNSPSLPWNSVSSLCRNSQLKQYSAHFWKSWPLKVLENAWKCLISPEIGCTPKGVMQQHAS